MENKKSFEPAPSDIFKDRLRAARDLRQLNQAELAAQTGLPPSSIAHFESGSRKPSFDNLKRLATALMVTTDYLLGRSDNPEMATSSDPLYRHVSNLSERDREIAEAFFTALSGKDRRRKEGD